VIVNFSKVRCNLSTRGRGAILLLQKMARCGLHVKYMYNKTIRSIY